MENFVVKKILVRKDGVKYIVIPKDCNLNSGDYVMISKVNKKEVRK